MDLFEFGGSEHVFAAAEDFDFIGDVELLEEPDDALGARVVEPAAEGQLGLCAYGRGLLFVHTSKA